MNEVNYNFYHWGPFLFHSTMDMELCQLMLEEGQKVRGVIVALEDDLRIRRALSVANDIEFYRYKVDFKLFKVDI